MDLVNIDPHKILNLSYDASWDDIKKRYKQLCIVTHPDKSGDPNSFIIIRAAYSSLKQRHKEAKRYSNAPTNQQAYSPQVAEEITPQKMKNFSSNKFNSFFDKNRINLVDPFSSNGYGNIMTQKLNYQEGVDVAKSNHVHIPTTKVVMFKEPESLLSSSLLESCYHLGSTDVTDFSGGGGTDIMKAYCHIDGDHIDTSRRYKNIEELQSERETQTFKMSKEERKNRKKASRLQERLEQLRLNSVQSSDDNLSRRYIQLNRRIV